MGSNGVKGVNAINKLCSLERLNYKFNFQTGYNQKRTFVALPLDDRTDLIITEKFVKGSGKGGQKVNKSSNAVFLREETTGIIVKSHATRYLAQNRKLARRILEGKLDELENGVESKKQKKIDKIRRRKAKSRQRSSIKYFDLEGKEVEVGEDDVDNDVDFVNNVEEVEGVISHSDHLINNEHDQNNNIDFCVDSKNNVGNNDLVHDNNEEDSNDNENAFVDDNCNEEEEEANNDLECTVDDPYYDHPSRNNIKPL